MSHHCISKQSFLPQTCRNDLLLYAANASLYALKSITLTYTFKRVISDS